MPRGTHHQADGSLGERSQAEVHPTQVLPLHEVSRGEQVDVDETHLLANLRTREGGGEGRGRAGEGGREGTGGENRRMCGQIGRGWA